MDLVHVISAKHTGYEALYVHGLLVDFDLYGYSVPRMMEALIKHQIFVTSYRRETTYEAVWGFPQLLTDIRLLEPKHNNYKQDVR